MSPYEAGFNLREIEPLSRTLHKALQRLTGLRTNPDAISYLTGYFFLALASLEVEAGHLSYPASVRDSAKSGLGCRGNRHLPYLAESFFVNVGDSLQNAKVSSPPMSEVSVGATIVVRDWESQSHAKHRCRCLAGEGSQSVGISSHTNRMPTRMKFL